MLGKKTKNRKIEGEWNLKEIDRLYEGPALSKTKKLSGSLKLFRFTVQML
jgi:hypothetical protein